MKPGFVGKAGRCGECGEKRPQYLVRSWQIYWIHAHSFGQKSLLGGQLLELLGEFRVWELHPLDEIFDAARISDAGQRVPKKRQVADERPNYQRDNKGQNGQCQSVPFWQFAF